MTAAGPFYGRTGIEAHTARRKELSAQIKRACTNESEE